MGSRFTSSCVASGVLEYADGVRMRAIPFGAEEADAPIAPGVRCSDCGVAVGGFHHAWCQHEECPRCHGQLISCTCGGADAMPGDVRRHERA